MAYLQRRGQPQTESSNEVLQNETRFDGRRRCPCWPHRLLPRIRTSRGMASRSTTRCKPRRTSAWIVARFTTLAKSRPRMRPSSITAPSPKVRRITTGHGARKKTLSFVLRSRPGAAGFWGTPNSSQNLSFAGPAAGQVTLLGQRVSRYFKIPIRQISVCRISIRQIAIAKSCCRPAGRRSRAPWRERCAPRKIRAAARITEKNNQDCRSALVVFSELQVRDI